IRSRRGRHSRRTASDVCVLSLASDVRPSKATSHFGYTLIGRRPVAKVRQAPNFPPPTLPVCDVASLRLQTKNVDESHHKHQRQDRRGAKDVRVARNGRHILDLLTKWTPRSFTERRVLLTARAFCRLDGSSLLPRCFLRFCHCGESTMTDHRVDRNSSDDIYAARLMRLSADRGRLARLPPNDEGATVHLFDDLIRPRQQRGRDREAEGFGGLGDEGAPVLRWRYGGARRES